MESGKAISASFVAKKVVRCATGMRNMYFEQSNTRNICMHGQTKRTLLESFLAKGWKRIKCFRSTLQQSSSLS